MYTNLLNGLKQMDFTKPSLQSRTRSKVPLQSTAWAGKKPIDGF